MREQFPYLKDTEPVPADFDMLVTCSNDKCLVSQLNRYFCTCTT